MSINIYNILEKLYLVPVILLSLSFHEFSHAYASYKLGDPTAKDAGRITLNPLKHLDILGSIMLLLTRFGWAKPVPINPLYYKDREKGTMLVSFAGPLSNIILAFLASFPMVFLAYKNGYYIGLIPRFNIEAILFNLSYYFYLININLAVFNILPVPPLDGSKILVGILPAKEYYRLLYYERYTGLIFMVLLFVFPQVLERILGPLIWAVGTGILTIVEPVVRLIL